MMANKSYHVLFMTELGGHTFNETADKIIAAVLITCVAVGLPGNVTSLLYFWGRRKDSFPDVLYTVISAVDVCTCALTLPIICSVISGRRPLGFFLNYTMCGVWFVPFQFTLRFSQFMVLVMSVTRTFTLLDPFHSVNKSAVLVACVVYAAYILIVKSVFLGSGVTKFFYFSMIASCVDTNSMDPSDWKYMILVMNNLISLVLLSIIVFVSFVLSIMALKRGSAASDNDFRRVSVTITIFTAFFLICNLPMFVAELMNNIVFLWKKSPGRGPVQSSFFVWYFILISYRVLIPFNAAMNPCLYFWRMKTFQTWIFECFRNCSIKFRKTDSFNKRQSRKISARTSVWSKV